MSREAVSVEQLIVTSAVGAARSASALARTFELNTAVQERSSRDFGWASDCTAFEQATEQLHDALATDAVDLVQSHLDFAAGVKPRIDAARAVQEVGPGTFVVGVVLVHVWADRAEARAFHSGLGRLAQSKYQCMVPSPLHVPLAVLVARRAQLVSVVWLPPLASAEPHVVEQGSGTAVLLGVLAAGAGLAESPLQLHPGADSRLYVTGVSAAVAAAPALPAGLAQGKGLRSVRLRPDACLGAADAYRRVVVPRAVEAVQALVADASHGVLFDAIGSSAVGGAVHAVGLSVGHLGALLPMDGDAGVVVVLELLVRSLKRLVRAAMDGDAGDTAVGLLLHRFRTVGSFAENELRDECCAHFGIGHSAVAWPDVGPFVDVFCFRVLADLGITEALDGPPAAVALPGPQRMPPPTPLGPASFQGVQVRPADAAAVLLRHYATTVAAHGLHSADTEASFLLCSASTTAVSATASVVQRTIAAVAPEAFLAAAVGESLFGNRSPQLQAPSELAAMAAAASAALDGPALSADPWCDAALWLGLGHALLSRLVGGGAARDEEEAFAVSECCTRGIAALGDLPPPCYVGSSGAAVTAAGHRWLSAVASFLRVAHRCSAVDVFGAAADALFRGSTFHPSLAAVSRLAHDLFSEVFRACEPAATDAETWKNSAVATPEARQLARATASLAAEGPRGLSGFPSAFIVVTVAYPAASAGECCRAARCALAEETDPEPLGPVLHAAGDGGYMFAVSHTVRRRGITPSTEPLLLGRFRSAFVKALHRRRNPSAPLDALVHYEAARRSGLALQRAVTLEHMLATMEALRRHNTVSQCRDAHCILLEHHEDNLRVCIDGLQHRSAALLLTEHEADRRRALLALQTVSWENVCGYGAHALTLLAETLQHNEERARRALVEEEAQGVAVAVTAAARSLRSASDAAASSALLLRCEEGEREALEANFQVRLRGLYTTCRSTAVELSAAAGVRAVMDEESSHRRLLTIEASTDINVWSEAEVCYRAVVLGSERKARALLRARWVRCQLLGVQATEAARRSLVAAAEGAAAKLLQRHPEFQHHRSAIDDELRRRNVQRSRPPASRRVQQLNTPLRSPSPEPRELFPHTAAAIASIQGRRGSKGPPLHPAPAIALRFAPYFASVGRNRLERRRGSLTSPGSSTPTSPSHIATAGPTGAPRRGPTSVPTGDAPTASRMRWLKKTEGGRPSVMARRLLAAQVHAGSHAS